MMPRSLALTVCLSLAACARAAEPDNGLVTGQDVRIRSGPGLTYRDMGLLDENTFVEIEDVSEDGKWLRVTPPAGADVWIFAKYVDVAGRRGVLKGDKVRVRVRPDLTGEVVNHVNKGAVVRVKERKGDWLRIAPPPNTAAWISARFVKRMTDKERAAFEAKLARRKAERQRVRRELARKKKAEERRRREAAAVAKAEEVVAGALTGSTSRRALEHARRAVGEAKKKIKDDALRKLLDAERDLLGTMQTIRTAMAGKTRPDALPKLDRAPLKSRPKLRPAIEALQKAHRQAEEIARKERLRRARRPRNQRELDGWVFYLGPGLKHTGATHRLKKGRETLALIKSDSADLASFTGMHVRIVGKVAGPARLGAGGARREVVAVNRIRIAF